MWGSSSGRGRLERAAINERNWEDDEGEGRRRWRACERARGALQRARFGGVKATRAKWRRSPRSESDSLKLKEITKLPRVLEMLWGFYFPRAWSEARFIWYCNRNVNACDALAHGCTTDSFSFCGFLQKSRTEPETSGNYLWVTSW